jgi:hypothetical protein
MNTLTEYLRVYRQKQEKILLCSRLSEKTHWGDRCHFLDNEYVQSKHYNHRSILANEVVVEFDDEDPNKNLVLAVEVSKKLKEDSIRHSIWYSGNKSYHLHFFIDTQGAKNIRLLKKIVMRYYTQGLDIKPDMRLAVDGHLVRAEFGIHEKTGRHKELIRRSPESTRDNKLPDHIWGLYSKGVTTIIKRDMTQDLNDVDKCSCIKYIADSTRFRENEDGRERALFVLIHALKTKYSKEELVEVMSDWYRYSGGYKLSPQDIERKVSYHHHKTYGTYTMVKELLEEFGRVDLLEQCDVHKGGVKRV